MMIKDSKHEGNMNLVIDNTGTVVLYRLKENNQVDVWHHIPRVEKNNHIGLQYHAIFCIPSNGSVTLFSPYSICFVLEYTGKNINVRRKHTIFHV